MLDPLPEEEEDDIEEPLDLPLDPDDELLGVPLPDPEPDPELVAEPDAEAPLELTADVAGAVSPGMSLWTQTPSAEKVFVPGMWMATVRVGASMRSTDSTSSSARRSPIR